MVFRLLMLGFVYFGAVAEMPVVWDMGEFDHGRDDVDLTWLAIVLDV